MKNRFVFIFLRATLLPRIIRETVQKNKVTIILYHDIKPDLFEEHLQVLSTRYNIISLKNYVKAVKTDSTEQLPKKSLIITFDDGHMGNRALLPTIQKYSVPCTIFLCSGIVGTNRHFWFLVDTEDTSIQDMKSLPDDQRIAELEKLGFEETREYENREALSWAEINEMKPDVDFQSHTVFHPILPMCSDPRAAREVAGSKKDLERTGFSVYALSYPNGDYSSRNAVLAQNAGYKCAITVDFGYNSKNTDPFRLKRICIPDDASVSDALVRASGLWNLLKKMIKGSAYSYEG